MIAWFFRKEENNLNDKEGNIQENVSGIKVQGFFPEQIPLCISLGIKLLEIWVRCRNTPFCGVRTGLSYVGTILGASIGIFVCSTT